MKAVQNKQKTQFVEKKLTHEVILKEDYKKKNKTKTKTNSPQFAYI